MMLSALGSTWINRNIRVTATKNIQTWHSKTWCNVLRLPPLAVRSRKPEIPKRFVLLATRAVPCISRNRHPCGHPMGPTAAGGVKVMERCRDYPSFLGWRRQEGYSPEAASRGAPRRPGAGECTHEERGEPGRRRGEMCIVSWNRVHWVFESGSWKPPRDRWYASRCWIKIYKRYLLASNKAKLCVMASCALFASTLLVTCADESIR